MLTKLVMVHALSPQTASVAVSLTACVERQGDLIGIVQHLKLVLVSGLHPMASLLGAFAGMKVLGILGFVLGPLALAYCMKLFSRIMPSMAPASRS